MSPRRRTLCFVLIFLLLKKDLDLVAGDYYPSSGSPHELVNSLLTVTSGPDDRVSPEDSQKFLTQQLNKLFSFGFSPPGLSIDTGATNNYGVNKPDYFNTCPTYSALETSNLLPVVETLTESLPCPSNVESFYPPVIQTIQVEGYAPIANVAEIYQTPVTVQIPSMPQLSPCIGVASPLPELLPSQNIIQKLYNPNVVPEIYPQTLGTITSVPVETTTLHIPSSDIGCCGQQFPALKINVASPWGHEPVRAVISQPDPGPSPSPSFNPSFSMPPAPIIVIEKPKSKLKRILPILLLALLGGGCGNNSGGGGSCGCSQCTPATPVPFPIIIPTNNPVITRGRSKGKGKASTDAKC